MNIRKFAVAASFALALVPMTALANAPHHWWMFDGNSYTCKNADTLPPPIFSSPFNMRQWLRLHGSANTKVQHIPGNLGLMVSLTGYFTRHAQHTTSFVYFSKEQGCQAMVQYLKQHGLAPNLNELK